MKRHVAVAIPACNEAGWIDGCLDRLLALPADPRVAGLHIVVLANNCVDDTPARAARRPGVQVIEIWFDPAHADAGHARRAAFDAAAALLARPGDVLASTDADTHVASDWLSRTLDYLDAGYDAVAGLARLKGAELRALEPGHRLRLAKLRRYGAAIDRLRGRGLTDEPWPRHFYEGGASMALTLDRYQAIGGAPTPSVDEDKALFDAVRRSGGRVRHPTDVKVFTSCRVVGRAPGGCSDTLGRWAVQAEDELIHEMSALDLGDTASGPLTFANLDRRIKQARELAYADTPAVLAEAC